MLKPRKVEAIRFFDTNMTLIELSNFIGRDISVNYEKAHPRLFIGFVDPLVADEGDYIVKHANGEIEVINEPYFNFQYQIQVGD